MRNMSFMLTTAQIEDRSKTVTRRLGWNFLKGGEHVMACEKCQGLRKGEKIRRITPLRVLSIRREPLDAITQADVIREGFPDWTPDQFIDMFTTHNKCSRDYPVNRIEFEYMEENT